MASINCLDHLSSATLSHNRINVAGRDLHETHNHNHNHYHIQEDPDGWRVRPSHFMNNGDAMYEIAISSSRETVAQASVKTMDELFAGVNYRVHSAKYQGRSVVVKVFHGPRAKEVKIEAINFIKYLRHPFILSVDLMASSTQSSEMPPLIIFDDDCESPVDYCAAFALVDSLPRILQLGFQLVGGLSAGLDYISTAVGMPLSSIGKANFEVYITKGDRVKIGIGSCNTENREQDDVNDTDWEIFNDLCMKTFQDANQLLYKEENVERDEATIIEVTDSVAAPNTANYSVGTSEPPGRSDETVSLKPRREWKWKTTLQISSLGSVARQYRNHSLICHPWYATSLGVRRLQGKRRSDVMHHRCQGYSKEEITFTAAVKDCAIISHTVPFPGEICLVCGEAVVAGLFHCICGESDDGFSATVKCSMCLTWQHRHCAGPLIGDRVYICYTCRPVDNGTVESFPISPHSSLLYTPLDSQPRHLPILTPASPYGQQQDQAPQAFGEHTNEGSDFMMGDLNHSSEHFVIGQPDPVVAQPASQEAIRATVAGPALVGVANHLNSHYGIRDHECDKCGIRFGTKHVLKRHARTCNGVRRKIQERNKYYDVDMFYGDPVHSELITNEGSDFVMGDLSHNSEHFVIGQPDSLDIAEPDPVVAQPASQEAIRATVAGPALVGVANHLNSHYGIRNHECDKCGSRFGTKHVLKRHARTCNGVRRKIQERNKVSIPLNPFHQ